MTPNPERVDLEATAKLIIPTFDSLVELYSDPSKRLAYSSNLVARLKFQGYPGWLQFYELGGDTSFIPYALELLGLDMTGFRPEHLSFFSPEWYRLLKQLRNSNRKSSKSVDDLERKALAVQLRYVAYINDFVCGLHYGESITELLPKARAGDERALFTILKVDKGILCYDWLLERVRGAQLTGDLKFLRKLGHAIAETPGIGRAKHLKVAFLLYALWIYGLNRMTTREIFEFLENQGLYGKKYGVYDVQTLAQLLNRLGLKKYQRSKKA